jgi:hypothetical protein
MTTTKTTLRYFWVYSIARRRPLAGVFAKSATCAVKKIARSHGISVAHLTAQEA